MIRKPSPIYALIALLIISTAASWAGKAVQIFVGDKPVDMHTATPAVLSADVCVPVRSFAEQLGAKVDWNGSTGTLTVSESSGIGIIRVGNPVATIRGISVHFPHAPFIMGGQVYAPILFFNQMFDQAWVFDPMTRQFTWIPIFPRYPAHNAPRVIFGPKRKTPKSATAPIPASRIIVSEVASVLPSRTNPKITIQTDVKRITYPVATDAIILRGRIGGQTMEVSLGDVLPGDRVRLHFNESGMLTAIRAQFILVTGKVRSIQENSIVLENGEDLTTMPETEVVLSGNVTGTLQDIHVGDQIVARVGPISERTFLIKVVIRSPNGHSETYKGQVSLSTIGPLNVGDVLIVRFKAQAGGKAVFTIPGVSANTVMTEVEPGTYQGQYTVQQGDVLLRQPIKITFAAPGGETYMRLSRPVIIQTAGGYLPRITYPLQGQEIESPLVVKGMAASGSTMRVTIEYRADLYRVLPMEGITAVSEVRADRDGIWETPPLSAVTPFFEDRQGIPDGFGELSDIFKFPEEPPVVYTITAAGISSDGREQAAYSIEVTKREGRS